MLAVAVTFVAMFIINGLYSLPVLGWVMQQKVYFVEEVKVIN